MFNNSTDVCVWEVLKFTTILLIIFARDKNINFVVKSLETEIKKFGTCELVTFNEGEKIMNDCVEECLLIW